MKLLLLEDDAALVTAVAQGLRGAGYAVDTAGSGEECAGLLRLGACDGMVLSPGAGADGARGTHRPDRRAGRRGRRLPAEAVRVPGAARPPARAPAPRRAGGLPDPARRRPGARSGTFRGAPARAGPLADDEGVRHPRVLHAPRR